MQVVAQIVKLADRLTKRTGTANIRSHGQPLGQVLLFTGVRYERLEPNISVSKQRQRKAALGRSHISDHIISA